MTDLGTLGGTYSQAYGINNDGQVVGGSYTTGDTIYAAFLYSGGVMTGLGTLGGTYGEARAINDNGQIAGGSYLMGDEIAHAFLYSGGVMTDLGSFGGASYGFGINNNGQVVGVSESTEYVAHAFLYDEGVMYDLNSLIDPASGWELAQALGINNSGQIVGVGYLNGSGAAAFLLTPTAVPIPAAIWLFGSGLLGLLGLVRQRKKTNS